MSDNSDELFTKQMKTATRSYHGISDALVKAKLVFALHNNEVWAEGLLVFYEIFKFLEEAMEETTNENLKKLYFEEMARKSAFEEDLKHYLGENWKDTYVIRDEVQNYLNHLENLKNTDSDLLMAYVYHLYMGLLSGGQLIKNKRELQNKIFTNDSYCEKAVTCFGGNGIYALKTKLRDTMNSIAKDLDEDKKALLIEESKRVFILNNSIIKTVQDNCENGSNSIIVVSFFVLVVGFVMYKIYTNIV